MSVFNLRKLSVLAYANAFTLWHFKGPSDEMADILKPGAFNDAEDLIAHGDHIHISAKDASGVASFVQVNGGLTAVLMVSTPQLEVSGHAPDVTAAFGAEMARRVGSENG